MSRLGWPTVVLVAAALALPAARMLVWVAQGTRVQFADYWFMADAIFDPSGSVNVRGVFRPHNEHLVVGAKGLYIVNTRLFGGSNRSLGVMVVVIALTQLGILTSHLARRRAMRPAVLVAFALAASAVTFVPQGAWSYLRAMSGAAWLTANLVAVVAVVLASRGRPMSAAVAATVSAMSYGTGIVAFPAAILAGLLIDRRVRRQWPLLVGGGVLSLIYLRILRDRPDSRGGDTSVVDALRNGARIIGATVADDPTVAAWVGAALVLIAIGLAVVARRSTPDASVLWIGLLAYSIGTVVLVGYGRANALGAFTTSRYTSLGALAWVTVIGLLALIGRAHLATIVPMLVIAAVAATGSSQPVDDVTRSQVTQRELATAFVLDLADGSPIYIGFGGTMPDVTDQLRAWSHHPFDGRWDADCGLLGRSVAAEEVLSPDEHDVDGTAGRTKTIRRWPRMATLVGTVEDPDAVDCIVVADASGTVVGVGAVSFSDLTEREVRFGRGGFRAIAPSEAGPLTAYVVLKGSDALLELPGD